MAKVEGRPDDALAWATSTSAGSGRGTKISILRPRSAAMARPIPASVPAAPRSPASDAAKIAATSALTTIKGHAAVDDKPSIHGDGAGTSACRWRVMARSSGNGPCAAKLHPPRARPSIASAMAELRMSFGSPAKISTIALAANQVSLADLKNRSAGRRSHLTGNWSLERERISRPCAFVAIP
jgi:hypothetical protein